MAFHEEFHALTLVPRISLDQIVEPWVVAIRAAAGACAIERLCKLAGLRLEGSRAATPGTMVAYLPPRADDPATMEGPGESREQKTTSWRWGS